MTGLHWGSLTFFCLTIIFGIFVGVYSMKHSVFTPTEETDKNKYVKTKEQRLTGLFLILSWLSFVIMNGFSLAVSSAKIYSLTIGILCFASLICNGIAIYMSCVYKQYKPKKVLTEVARWLLLSAVVVMVIGLFFI